MQQTNKYKLNLIERDDPFSPDALNENTRKVEEVLAAYQAGETAAREKAIADLNQRVQVFEAQRFVCGTYVGNGGQGHMIELGFTPRVVFMGHQSSGSANLAMVAEGYPLRGGTTGGATYAVIVSNGFQVNNITAYDYNVSGNRYFYFAIL